MSDQAGPQQSPKRKRPWYFRWWAWVIWAFVLIFVVPATIANLVSGGGTDDLTAPATTSETPTSTPTPGATLTVPPGPSSTSAPSRAAEPAPAPKPKSTKLGNPPVEIHGDLSYTVWSSVLGNFIGGITTSSPLYPVYKVEDVSSDTVRVYVQENLSKDEKTRVGRQVFTLGAFDNTDLQIVVVRDASGVDTNVYRSSVPGLQQ